MYLCTDWDGEPRTDEKEMTDPRWLDPAEIRGREGVFPPFRQSLALLAVRKAVTFSEASKLAFTLGQVCGRIDIEKYNHNHDWLGRFSSGTGGSALTGRDSKAPKTLPLPDIEIGRSLGAKAKNYRIKDLRTGEYFNLVEGSHLQNVEVFAGKGVSTPFRRAAAFAKKHGGKAENWQHVKGFGEVDYYGESRKAELHWAQCEGIGKIDFFIKEWLE